MAVKLLLFWGVLLPITLFFNISLFVALLRSTMKHKPLLVLYGSLLLGLCVDKLMICVYESVVSPYTIGYCVCIDLALVLLSLPRVFFVVYSVVVATCQSVLQLLIMKGNQQCQDSYKRSIGCLIVSAVLATVWTVCFIIGNMFSEYPQHCHSFCETPQRTNQIVVISMEYASLYVVGAYAVSTLVPALVVTITTSIWAFVIFRKKFMATSKKDIAFSRRMFLLPVLMVILLICNSLLSYLITVVTARVFDKTHFGPFFGNWANVFTALVYFVLDILHALSYPLVLLFLYSRLRRVWNSLFSCKKEYSDNNNGRSPRNYRSSPVDSTTNV